MSIIIYYTIILQIYTYVCIDKGRPSGWEQTRRCVPGDLLGGGQKQF